MLQEWSSTLEYERNFAAREKRLRRWANQRGLTLRKSRRRDPRYCDYGRYWLLHNLTNVVVAGDSNGGHLDEIEAYLTS